MANFSVPSKEETQSSGGFADKVPLPGNEDYLCSIAAITTLNKPDFNGKLKDFLRVELDVLSFFPDGGAIEDINGHPAPNRKIWKDIDITRLGFRKDGVASISRQFLVYASGGTDITERIPEGNTDELVGKQIVISLIVDATGQDRKQRNKIIAFKPAQKSRRRTHTVSADAVVAPAVDDEYAKAVASLINDSDDPSTEEVEEVKGKMADAAKA